MHDNPMVAEDPKNDGRGIMGGGYLLHQDRPLDEARWREECFPEWGTFINRQIAETEVARGQVNLWWFGAGSFCLKTSQGSVFVVDSYAGPAHYTEYEDCGVCRTSGAETINWVRLWPQVWAPWGWHRLDALFSTHLHSDHCDIYTVAACNQTTDCSFVGPLR